MPELPEVETIARALREGKDGPPLPGKHIVAVTIKWPRHFERPKARTARKRLTGRRIESVSRRGKYLVMRLDEGTLLIHLRMSGDLRLEPAGQPPGRFDHTIFHLGGDWELRFSDARKFGRIWWLQDPQLELGKLGPEPLSDDFTTDWLAAAANSRKRMLKPLLLDQSFLAGVGNIYADEALHRAGLHPRRRSDSLSNVEIEALYHGIREALSAGLRHCGASIDWVYRGGDFQNHFRVHRREGLPCPECGTPIERIVVGQRGTYLCPRCQREDLR